MKKRLFIATDLPRDIRENIVRLENELDKEFGERLAWIPPENLHLTLLFLGYTEESETAKIAAILGSFEKPEPFELTISEVKYGPDDKIKRMVWLGFRQSKELFILQKSIEAALGKGSIPFHREYRPYNPHINLIRFRESLYKPDIARTLNWQFAVDRFSLKESVLKRSGAEYRDIVVFRLR